MRPIFTLIGAILVFGSGFGCVRAVGQEAAKPPALKIVSHWSTKNALVVPFEYNAEEEGAPAIWLRLNDSKPRLFVVDTGTSDALALRADVAKKLGIQPRNEGTTRTGVAYSDFCIRCVRLWPPPAQEDKRKKVRLLNVTGIILKSLSFSPRIYASPPAGLIGNHLLQRLGRAVRFDFVSRKMTFYRHVEAPLRLTCATTIALHKADRVYAVNAPLSDGKEQEMLVDTGDEGPVYIPQRCAVRFETQELTSENQTTIDVWGEHSAIESLIPVLKIGGFVEKNVPTMQGQSGDAYCLLGINYLSRFCVTLDYAHSELTLERASDYKRHLYKP